MAARASAGRANGRMFGNLDWWGRHGEDARDAARVPRPDAPDVARDSANAGIASVACTQYPAIGGPLVR